MLLLGLVAALLAAACCWQWLRPAGPAVRGKPLGVWLRQYDASRITGGDPHLAALQDEATAAIRELGTNAVPYLLATLRVRDTWLAAKSLELFGKQKLVKAPWRPAKLKNIEGMEGFEILGSAASNAATALGDILDRRISPSSQVCAVQALSALGSAGGQGIPSLSRCATNSLEGVRIFALDALYSVSSRPSQVVPVLEAALSDPSSNVRRVAASLLARCGPEAQDATPALARLLQDGDKGVRDAARAALRQIEPPKGVSN